jgi:hypothetical protein
MACKYVNGEFIFNQPCGEWNVPCKHGCGYYHLSSSTVGTRKKCCANGRLSSLSDEFDEELTVGYDLDPFPDFMQRIVFNKNDFTLKSSTYNNLVAMAATVVCNYRNTNGFTRRGEGPQSVFMNGRIHHYMREASNTSQNCGLSYFIFDEIASMAASAERQNVDPEILTCICEGLRRENPYCIDLRFLGVEARQRAEGNVVIPRMIDQARHFDVCSVVNNRQTGEMVLHVQTRGCSVSYENLDSEKVESLCFPLFFPHAERGYTNMNKHRLSPDAYAMSRLLKPEKKLHGNFMMARADHGPYECVDSRTGEPFCDEASFDEVNFYKVPDEVIHRELRVNRFMLLSRLAQYWVLDFYSRVLDQRMSAVRKMQGRIMMGQKRQRPVNLTQNEEDDRRAAGCDNVDEGQGKESYLPGSVHGSPRHMASLARNALVLVSEYGCPHLFITLTCNPKWPEILSQLVHGQTSFDRPDVTAAVFKSRLDQFKMNLRNGKYFGGRKPIYEFHVIEYQYRGLPHAHLVARLENAHDVHDQNRDALINFVNSHFVAEMPRFERERNQNVFQASNVPIYTDEYKQKAIELVRMHNTHKCAVAVNGCKKHPEAVCNRGYGRNERIPVTYVDEHKHRAVYRRREECDKKIVPYNLQIMMDWDSHINVEFCGSAYCALYMYKYCYKGAAKVERISLSNEEMQDSRDEIKLFIYGRTMSSMSAVWRLYGYQDYPAPHPPVFTIKVRNKAQLAEFEARQEVTDLQIYYNRPQVLNRLKFADFFCKYNVSTKLPKYYRDNPNTENNQELDRHYFKVYVGQFQLIRYVYCPVKPLQRCVRIEMLYITSGDIYYLRLILLKRNARDDKDVLTYYPERGGGASIVFSSYQQSAIAHGFVESVADVRATFDELCTNGTAQECRNYFVILTLHGYATHDIFDDPRRRRWMYLDYLTYDDRTVTVEYAHNRMLQSLQRQFRKSHSSLEKYGFPKPNRVPTELEEEITVWMNDDAKARQRVLLEHLNETFPNNYEQQLAFDRIMTSIASFNNSNRDDVRDHVYHFISGPGGTGKSCLFKKLHAACRSQGILISLCASTSLAALIFDGAVTAHSLFSYPVEDESDIDDVDLPKCNFRKERCDLMYQVSVIFWDEFISSDRMLFEAVIEAFRTTWEKPRYFVFVCAGDFCQVS